MVEARKGVYNKFIKDVLRESVIIEYDYTIFPEMQSDLLKQSQVAAASNWLTVDEKRSMMGYEPLQESERKNVLIPSGLSTLEDLYSTDGDIDEEQLDPNI